MSTVSAHLIVAEDPRPFRVASYRLSWPDDPEAGLTYALKPDTAYIVGITRGRATSGTQILQAFQSVAETRRIKVIGVDFPTIGFWEKMLERKLIHDWGMEDPKLLL